MLKKNPRKLYLYLGMFTFLFVFFLLTVLSGDDFSRLAQVESSRVGGRDFFGFVAGFYSETNGRLLGNSMHYAFVDVPVLSALARAGITLGIVWSIARLARVRYLPALPVIALLTLVPSVPVLRQAIVWSAGYYNYVVPVFLAFLVAVLLREWKGRWRVPVIFIVAVAAGLFMETVTLALLVASVGLCVVRAKQRRFSLAELAFLLGAIVGAVLMFSSPGYRKVLSGEDTYRPMFQGDGPLGSIIARLEQNLPTLGQHLALDNAILYIGVALAVVFGGRLWRHTRRPRVAPGVMLGSAFAFVFLQQVSISKLGGALQILIGAGVVALFLVFAVSLFVSLWPTQRRANREAALWMMGGVVVAGPFLLIAPFGPRNIFVTTACFVLGAFIVLAPRLNVMPRVPYVGRTLMILSVIVGGALLSVMAVNKAVDITNRASAEEQVSRGEEVITLRNYPFGRLVHRGDDGGAYAVSFQEYECDENRECEVTRRVQVVFE